MNYIIKYFFIFFLLIIISTNTYSQDSTLFKIDELSFKINIKDWKIKSDKSKQNQITLYKEKVSILTVVGSSVITVYKENLSNEAVLKTKNELIDSIFKKEVQMLQKDAKTGRFVLLDTNTSTINKYGKDYYTLSFQTKLISKIPFDGENILYLYFPFDYKERKVYYGFLVSEYLKENSLFSENDLRNIEPILQSMKIEGK